MQVRKICQWCGKPFIAQKTTTCYCSHQCSNLGYKERIRERRRQLKRAQELLQPRQAAEGQDFFSFAQAAKLMGVTRQYIYKLVKESKLRASRLSGKKSLIRRADIELMMKTKPYERIMPKDDFDITEYYTAEEIAQKYKVNTKWVWTYTRQHKVPKVRIRQFNYYSKKHIDAAFAKYEVDSDLTEWYTPEEIQEKYGMTRIAIRSHVYRNNIPLQEGARADLLLEAALRPLEEQRGGEQGRILHRQGSDGAVQPLARRGVRRAAVPPDPPREERALRPLPESGVRPRDGSQKVAPIPVRGK